VQTNVFLPGHLLIGDGDTLTIAQDDFTAEFRLDIEFFQVLQKANSKRRLACITMDIHHTNKRMLEL
jgi:hypothetical protein